MGPLLAMGIMQIRGFEPGDADWGVKLDDVRGQAEAKEEVRRVVTLWQSGEAFEEAGGKRERGLLFLGAPGTGKTMLAKAIATGFNSPIVTIPGSGFASTFIGIDAVLVRYLAHKARKLARRWGGQCIVFIDEIDAIGLRRQSLGGVRAATSPSTATASTRASSTGRWARINPSGDLILETRGWRERLFELRAEGPAVRPPALVEHVNRFMMPPGMMGGGSLALNQLLVVMDGISNPPFKKRLLTNKANLYLDARLRHPPAHPRAQHARAAAEADQRADLLRRRLQRAHRGARSGPHAPGPSRPARLVPHADQAGSARHLQPVHRPGRRTSPTSTRRSGATRSPASRTATRRP